MTLLKDLFPVLLFFLVYKFTDIYLAVAVMIVAVTLQTLYIWFRDRHVPWVQRLTLVLVWLFGGATIVLRDPVFIQWKPTILQWLLAAAFIVSHFVGGGKVVIQRLLEAKVNLPERLWLKLNVAWILFFIFSGGLNLYVAHRFDENVWVNFKLFGMMGLTLLFVLAQGAFLARYLPENSEEK